METTNPYQSPALVAESGPDIQRAGVSPLLGIIAVAIGAVAGGFVAMVVVGWFDASRELSYGIGLTDQQIFRRLFCSLPIGSVIGGLLSKWCLLQFVRNR